MKKAIKIVAAVLVVTMLALSMLSLITSCSTAKFSEEDKKTAEACAEKEAKIYYTQYFKGKTKSGVKYSDCDVSVKESEFKSGKYIVTIDVYARASYQGYSLNSHLMDIKYTITVKDGTANVVNTDYITD